MNCHDFLNVCGSLADTYELISITSCIAAAIKFVAVPAALPQALKAWTHTLKNV
jgi:hypothetical protein